MNTYLFFHSIVEIVAATISFGTFLFTWNTRRFQNPYLLTVGAAALFVGAFEVLHCLAFPGMPIFGGHDANLSPQLWLSARLFQAGSALVGLLLLSRVPRMSAWPLLVASGAAFAGLCAAVFSRQLPEVVLPGGGLTPFKVWAEWLLAAAFLGSTAILLRVRERFSRRVFHLLVAHGVVMAACEICFTLYGHPYDAANFLGHVFLLAGVTLQYQAILRSGLIDPDETTFRDLTQAKERLERVEQALRDADRAKNEFLAMVSHELRNPLAPIRNSLEVMELAPADSEAARGARAVIGRQVAQLVRLIDDLLDITRVSRQKLRLHLEPLELGEIVLRAVEDHRTLFDAAGVTLALQGAPRKIQLEADASRLAQVVGNLLQNAVKFTPRGGRVSVTIDVGAEPGRALIRVCDTGVGMRPEVLASLFQPFVQADATLARSRGGLGLGLALVKGLTELHGGEVRASSPGEGKGAEFVVSLPLEASRPSPSTAIPGGAPSS